MTFTHRFYVHPSDVGFIVGKGGKTIQRIERNTASRIFLCDKPTPTQIKNNKELRPFQFFFIQTSTPYMIRIISDMLSKIAKESENRRKGIFHHAAKTKPRPSGIQCLRGADEPLIVELTDGEDSDSDSDSEDM